MPVPEHLTHLQMHHEKEFIEEVCQMDVMKYVHKYLVAKGLVPSDLREFRNQLYTLWFELFKRLVQNDTCAFKHGFAGEIRGEEVVGFHNWITFLVEEKAGRADYHGFILPKSKTGKGAHPTGKEHILSCQLKWRGCLKPISSFLMGVSPEYEIALYTLVFYAGNDGLPVRMLIDGVECEVVVHRFRDRRGEKIGTVYVSIVN
ncbi:hypothetical protein HDU98_009209 [Podochytrium sp. JEL0797]|nr:hypothetical protein HDU98_009209 [Podochytrium sp. JEL0797]